MPVVGRRYKPTEANEFIGNKNYIVSCDEILSDRVILDKNKDGSYFSFPIKDFFKYFEELPDQPQVNDEVKVNGVEEALKELNTKYFDKEAALDDIKEAAQNLINAIENTDVIKTCPNCKWNYFSLLTDPTKFCSPDCEAESEGVKVPCVGANCEGCNCKKEKHKSLWKDVSEEPNSPQVITDGENFRTLCFFNNGQFEVAGSHVPKTEINGSVTIKRKYVANVKKYLELTDFVNAFEQLQRDVEDIKRKIK